MLCRPYEHVWDICTASYNSMSHATPLLEPCSNYVSPCLTSPCGAYSLQIIFFNHFSPDQNILLYCSVSQTVNSIPTSSPEMYIKTTSLAMNNILLLAIKLGLNIDLDHFTDIHGKIHEIYWNLWSGCLKDSDPQLFPCRYLHGFGQITSKPQVFSWKFRDSDFCRSWTHMYESKCTLVQPYTKHPQQLTATWYLTHHQCTVLTSMVQCITTPLI